MSPTVQALLLGSFIVFCAALFALVWRAQYASRLDAAASALRQATVLAASAGRLIIETSGPLGTTSHDLKQCRGSEARTIRAFRLARCDRQRRVDCLQVLLSDGTTIHVLPGRDVVELKWVATALRSAIERH
jgi:hypothetical protein